MQTEPLAIHGGPPVRSHLLPYGHQTIDDEDISAVVEALRANWLTTGPKVAEFEEAFAKNVSAKYAIAVSSGTAALHAAASAANLGSGDEVITTPFTFCATVNSALFVGASPVLADVCPDTLNIDPSEIASKTNSRTKAVIAVDYAGHPAELERIRAFADSHKLIFIEDACHALGAMHLGKSVGAWADMTVFSFHPVKHITTCEGGMVVTDNPEFAQRIRRFRNHGIAIDARERQLTGSWLYEITELGYNYRIPDVACALGLSQLSKLDRNIERRRQIAKRYSLAFEEWPELLLPVERAGSFSSWHLYPVRFHRSRVRLSRAEIYAALRAENIGVSVHYIPVHFHPYYKQQLGWKRGQFPVAESAYEQLITLPMFHGMNDSDVQDVIHAVEKVVLHCRY